MQQNPFCITPIVCKPKAILEDSIRITAFTDLATITLDVNDDIASVMVDRVQILRVFTNLIINALQAMPPSPHAARVQIRATNVTLTPEQVPPLPSGGYVRFEVRDNGSGIKPEHVAKVFDPYFTTKKHADGLGLDIVLSVIRAHGGQVGLCTEAGKGTSVTVFLPRAGQFVAADLNKQGASVSFAPEAVVLHDSQLASRGVVSQPSEKKPWWKFW